MKDKEHLADIGKRISKIRQKHNMTQAQLAEKLNVSSKHISHTECGNSGLSLKNLIELCNYFNCSLDYLVFGKDKSGISEKLPAEIVDILNLGSDREIERLNNYLKTYIELTSE